MAWINIKRDKEMLNLAPRFSTLNNYDGVMCKRRNPTRPQNWGRVICVLYFELVAYKVNWDFKGRCHSRIEIHMYGPRVGLEVINVR